MQWMTGKERQRVWRQDGFDPHGMWKAVAQGQEARGMPWQCWFKMKKDAHQKVERKFQKMQEK